MKIRSSAVDVIADCTLANYQTCFAYNIKNGWYARSDSMGRVYERTRQVANLLQTCYWETGVMDFGLLAYTYTRNFVVFQISYTKLNALFLYKFVVCTRTCVSFHQNLM